MLNVWLFISGSSNGEMHCVPVFAKNEREVVKHMINHINDFFFMYEMLASFDDDHGQMYDELAKWYTNEAFYRMIDDKSTKKEFIKDIKKILHTLLDSEIITGLSGSGYDCDGKEKNYITVKKISSDDFIIAYPNNSIEN